MCRQKGNSHIKYLESVFFWPLSTSYWILHVLGWRLRGRCALIYVRLAPESGEETGCVLTVDCDFYSFGVGRGDVVLSAAFVVSGLVPRDASDVQMFVLLAWKQKRTLTGV